MKIFLDTANREEIKKYAILGIVDGVTTNPTHLSVEGGNPTQVVTDICTLLPDGIISVEITEQDPNEVYKQAHEIAQLAKNIAVKIPCHENYYPIIKQLVLEKISLNITLVFSLIQGLMMCKLGVDYISPFIGRLDDIDDNGIELVKELRTMITTYNFKTKIIAASIRDVQHIHSVIRAGSDIATIPTKLITPALTHQLTDKGMTQFLENWKTLNIQQFPEKKG